MSLNLFVLQSYRIFLIFVLNNYLLLFRDRIKSAKKVQAAGPLKFVFSKRFVGLIYLEGNVRSREVTYCADASLRSLLITHPLQKIDNDDNQKIPQISNDDFCSKKNICQSC